MIDSVELLNLHKMTHHVESPDWVAEEIMGTMPKVFICSEYTHDENLLRQLSQSYWLDESREQGKNGILIGALKSVCKTMPQIKKTVKGPHYDALHIVFQDTDEDWLNVIGVRMRSPMDASIQTPGLVKYLKSVNGPFLCGGDYNITYHRMPVWFRDFKLARKNVGEDKLSNFSTVVAVDEAGGIKDFAALDHVLVSADLQCEVSYDWDFVKNDKTTYPPKECIDIGTNWSIPIGYPDHAFVRGVVKKSI